MPSANVMWITRQDNNVCPICKALHGYVWTFENEIPTSLIHPIYGEVWNQEIGSLAHERKLPKSHHELLSLCRCNLKVISISAPELLAALTELKNNLKNTLQVKT